MRNNSLEEQIKDGFIHQRIVDIRDSEGESLEQSVYLNWEFDKDSPLKTVANMTFENEKSEVLLTTQRIYIDPQSNGNFITAYTALLQLIDRKAPFYNLCMKEIMNLRACIERLERFDPTQCDHYCLAIQPSL